LDSFFATRHDEAENNKTRVRVSIGGSLEEGSDPALSYAGKWVTRPDQAALVSATSFTAMPSANLMPSMSLGN
jgi:hypothetical protein